MSKGTGFTIRQKEGFKAIGNGATEMKVKSQVTLNGSVYLDINAKLPVFKSKCIKISDHGSDNISSLVESDIDNINFNQL